MDFNFKGTTDVTSATPPVGSDVVGNYYINETAGQAGAGWIGIEGETIALNQIVVYTALSVEDGGPWASGAEPDLSVYVPLAGTDAITGDLTSSAKITATHFIASNTLDVPGTVDSNLTPSGNGAWNLGTTTNEWYNLYSKEANISGDVSVSGNFTEDATFDKTINSTGVI